MAGGSGSVLVGVVVGLGRLGAGDRRRGETGHLGLSFRSETTALLAGVAVGSEDSLLDGLSAGAAEVERLRVDAVCVGICDRDGRVGLGS